MIELSAAEADDLIDTWAGIVQATVWANAPVLSDRGPTTVLVPMDSVDAHTAIDAAVLIGWFDTEGRLSIDNGTDVITLYEGAP